MIFLGLIRSQSQPWSFALHRSCTARPRAVLRALKRHFGHTQVDVGWENPQRTSSSAIPSSPSATSPGLSIPQKWELHLCPVIKSKLFFPSDSPFPPGFYLFILFIYSSSRNSSEKIKWEQTHVENGFVWLQPLPRARDVLVVSGGKESPKPFFTKPGAGFVVVPALCSTDELEFGSWLEEAREGCLCWISQPTEQTREEKQLQLYHFTENYSSSLFVFLRLHQEANWGGKRHFMVKILVCLPLKHPYFTSDFLPHITHYSSVCQNCEFGCYFVFPQNKIRAGTTHRCLTFILGNSCFSRCELQRSWLCPCVPGGWLGCPNPQILKSSGSPSPTSHCTGPSPGSAALLEFQHNFLSLGTYAKKPERFLKWKCHFHASNVFYGAF